MIKGRLVEFPYPALDVDGQTPGSYWLGDKMLQLDSDGIDLVSAPPETKPSSIVRIRTVSVVGELVDSKCHLGMMRPG